MGTSPPPQASGTPPQTNPDPMQIRYCANCAFYDSVMVICRRVPANNTSGQWPTVKFPATDWCGCHEFADAEGNTFPYFSVVQRT